MHPLRVAKSLPKAAACLLACATLCGLAAVLPARAQEAKPAAAIYSCIDANGKRLTSDRPIRECLAREQLLLNRDGSVRQRIPPSMTAEERAEYEARERALAEQRAAVADAGRRDRNLLQRYPSEASHQRAREQALDTVRLAIRASEQRLRELEVERRPLEREAEFYEGRQLPPNLKQALDANDAAVIAQRDANANQQAELGRVNRLYDIELERLRRLWAGAPPGSMGPLAVPQAAAAAGGARQQINASSLD
jgi:hypothetical protein